ncbi:MAG: hypothetical protein ACJ8AT_20740 [Hyalangium sp.]
MHFQERRGSAPTHPVRQFFHGLFLPFHLFVALWKDPVARRRFLRVGFVQSLIILALAFAYSRWSTRNEDDAQERSAPAGLKTARQLERGHFKLQMKIAAEKATRKAKALAQKTGEKAPEVDEEADPDEADEAEGATEAEQAEAAVTAPKPKRFIDHDLEFWAALFAAMHMAQWVVIALSRDFHDTVSRDASLLTGLEPEDEPVEPRVRLDLKWLRRKISRRFRAFMVFTVGVPILYGISSPLPFRHPLASMLITSWSVYWIVVFTASQSGHAWRNPEAGPPWFLRGWSWLTTRVPGFRWAVPRAYGRFWENQTRSLFSPAAELEKQPWAFAGLALTGMLSMIPLMKCFLRPLMPVAAAHLLVARHTAERAAALASEAPSRPAASSSANAA